MTVPAEGQQAHDGLEAKVGLIADAVLRTCAQVGLDRFTQFAETSMQMALEQMTERLRLGDQPTLFLPVECYVGRKWEMGAVLMLEDRAIFSWWSGILRIRNYSQAVAYDAIREVRKVSIVPATRREPEKVRFALNCTPPLAFSVMRPKGAGCDLPFMTEAALLGALSVGDG
jgi:hypothetical protein